MAAATADTFTTPNERALSGAMALVTHVLFLALIVFGVSWQKRQPEAMVVDLWNNLPPMAAPKPEPAPEVQPEPPPPKPEPEPKVEAKPVPKPETKPAPKREARPTVKPDIALKDKKEKEKDRKAAEQAALEKKKREQEEALRKLAGQQVKEAEAKQQAAARDQQEAQKKLAAQRASEEAKLIDEYQRRIGDRIKRFIQEPGNLQGNPAVQFEIIIFPGGEVQGVKTMKSSGQSAWDDAVERAILKASPLPVPPPDSPIARHFRAITPVFKPKE